MGKSTGVAFLGERGRVWEIGLVFLCGDDERFAGFILVFGDGCRVRRVGRWGDEFCAR